jgi:UDP-N-acetylglucosamine--N-acetylmuramyl-(pentapeptide) pyrophosphoryl-undecaprenol N-acetylglucosamine transferase
MKVLIATGSSGGHIFPAVALMEALRKSGAQVLLVLPQKNQQNNFLVAAGQVEYIPAVNFSLKLSRMNLVGSYLFLCCAWKSLRIIIKFKPEVVVGFGSLNTVALIFWAWLFRIKTMLHEQNVICGRANRLLAKLVDRVAVSFSQTCSDLDIAPEKIVLTGNPLRLDMCRVDKKEALDFFGFKEGKLTILVTGGSQGSHRLNVVCLEALAAYQKNIELQVIHICGAQDLGVLGTGYASSALQYKLFDFLLRMQYAYSVADLVICRAGATTIAELQKFKIPAILIPYPFAYAHQSANAFVLEKIKAAWVIRDQEFTPEKLKAVLNELLLDPQKLVAMRQAYDAQLAVSDAAGLLAKEVLAVV